MKSAVLLIVFNRPGTTKRVFEAIRRARPPRLYVAADGPRSSRPADAARCEETRRIATAVDWPCELHTLFRDANLGCKMGVAGGIDWFFDNEQEGIILEDDCRPAPDFFPYCDELLERYRDDRRVLEICGSNFIGAKAAAGKSYFFTNYPDIWGWATWRRAWQHYDVTMAGWPAARDAAARAAHGSAAVEAYWTANFDQTWRGEIDTWDYQWLFMCWRLGGLAIAPAVNLIENLGFDGDATHTNFDPPGFLVPAGRLAFPLIHPDAVAAAPLADARISSRRYEINRAAAARRAIRRLPVVGDVMARCKTLVRRLLRGAGSLRFR